MRKVTDKRHGYVHTVRQYGTSQIPVYTLSWAIVIPTGDIKAAG